MLLQGLEAEKNLLAAAEARAAGEAAEHFRERCRLSAELEAAHKIHTAKCDVLVVNSWHGKSTPCKTSQCCSLTCRRNWASSCSWWVLSVLEPSRLRCGLIVSTAVRHFYREEEAAREAARLGEELRKLQREWRDAAAALDAERRRANDAVAARDGDRATTADK